MAREAGFQTFSYVVLGLPAESMHSVRETRSFLLFRVRPRPILRMFLSLGAITLPRSFLRRVRGFVLDRVRFRTIDQPVGPPNPRLLASRRSIE